MDPSAFEWTPADVLTSDRYLAFASSSNDIAYIKTDAIFHGRPINWRGTPHRMRPAKIWLTGHSDYDINTTLHNKYSRFCRIWFAQNKNTVAPNIFALPLGITNDCDDSPIHRVFGNNQDMWDVWCQPRSPRSQIAYANFAVSTWPTVRAPLLERLKQLPWVHVGESVLTREGRRAYLTEVRNHDFCFCPRGNGIDTHRLWETLYVGGIPIVERHIALAEFEDLPICWVDRFEEVSEEMLVRERERIRGRTDWNMEKLKIGWWEQRIQEALA